MRIEWLALWALCGWACEEAPESPSGVVADAGADQEAGLVDQGLADGGPDAADPDGGPPDQGLDAGALDDAGSDPACTPFAGAVSALLAQRCATAGCHGGDRPAQGLSLAPEVAWAELVGQPAAQRPDRLRVEPGRVARSYLIEKLSPNPSVGNQMPLGGQLSAADRDLIEGWVATGAAEHAEDCGEPPPASVAALEIEGDGVVDLGGLGRLTVEAFDAEGLRLEASVGWVAQDPQILYVDGEGGLVGLAVGTTSVRAVAGAVESAALEIEVVEATPEQPGFAAALATLVPRCARAGCHVDGVEPGDLRFDRGPQRMWRELVEDASSQIAARRVTPGRPDQSYLVEKLSAPRPTEGARMPLADAPLPAEEMAVVVRWILGGAPPPN